MLASANALSVQAESTVSRMLLTQKLSPSALVYSAPWRQSCVHVRFVAKRHSLNLKTYENLYNVLLQ